MGENLKRGGNKSYNSLYRLVALDLSKRYVRFNFRVSVSKEQPYQLAPQFPRYFPVEMAIKKLQRSIEETNTDLAKGVSDRDSTAKGKELQDDLERMRTQNFERHWMVKHLQSSLEQLHNTPSFSKIK